MLTERQRQAVELLEREPMIGPRRVAGEYGWRSQDAGRVLRALIAKGVVEFAVVTEKRRLLSGLELEELVAGYRLTELGDRERDR